MKKIFVALSMVAFLAACGDDSSSASVENNGPTTLSSAEEQGSSSSSSVTSTGSVTTSSSLLNGVDELSRSSSSEQNAESSSSSADEMASSSSGSDVPQSYAEAKVMPSGTYDCTKYKCVTTEYLNQEILEAGKYGEILDQRDGQVYKTVQIEEQIWMAENLNYADSAKTPSLLKNSWCYDNDQKRCDVAGRLYTWAAAMDSVKTGCGYGSTCEIASANSTGSSTGSATLVQGICPTGWHLPDITEWNTLFTAVGGRSTADKVLKSQSGWYGNGTDAFGFSARPAGYSYNYGYFYGEGDYAFFWSSTEYYSNRAYYMSLHFNFDNADLSNSHKDYGYSVRCVKD